jgi:hypothetical protein
MVGAIRAGDMQSVDHHHPGVAAGSGKAVDHGQQSDTIGRRQRSTFNKGILHVDVDECGFRGDELIFGHIATFVEEEAYFRHSNQTFSNENGQTLPSGGGIFSSIPPFSPFSKDQKQCKYPGVALPPSATSTPSKSVPSMRPFGGF